MTGWGGGQAGWPVSCHIHTQGAVRVWPSQGAHLLCYGDHSWAQFGGGGRGWVRDRKGGKVTSYDWLGWPVSWHIHTQGAVHFSLHSEHTSCIMARIVLTGTVNC